jgi:predicted dithiol-disulfide oxidoreductase (DUF899 family)
MTLSLSRLFEGRLQLIVYHFVLGLDWQDGGHALSGPIISMVFRSISIIAL